MTDYKIRIVIEGIDKASGPLGSVGRALGGVGQVAGGILSANMFMGIARGIVSLGTSAIGATANLQAMELGMATLAAREIATTENTRRLAEAAKKGMKESEVAIMAISDALPLAEEKAKGMMAQLEKIAIVSPYQLEVVQGSYQMAQAFGYTGAEALKFTEALLNVAAGVGADNERMGRMAYNLAQIRMVGKVTAIDLRQLSMAGFDLNSVLRYMGKELGLQIQNHEDFNKMLASGKVNWEQFTEYFMKYADENFGGAAERMSRTLKGLASTFQDVMVLTFPKLLGPAAETFTEFANKILDGFLKIRESGVLEQLGEGINSFVKGAVEKLTPFVDKIMKLFDAIANPVSIVFEDAQDGARRVGGEFDELGARVLEVHGALENALANLLGLDVADIQPWLWVGGALADAGFWSIEFKEALGALVGGPAADWILTAANGIRQFVDGIKDFLADNVQLSDILTALGLILAATIVPAVLAFAGSVAMAVAPFAALVAVIALLRQAWTENWGGIRDTLTQVWQETIWPALQTLYEWLQVNIPLAIQAVSEYWTGTLLPALVDVWAWVQANLLPILAQVWEWLGVNVPLAIQTVSTWFTETLVPALTAAWEWIQTNLIPVLGDIWDWLATNIPGAIETFRAWWEETLIPALDSAWEFISTYILPIFQDIYDIALLVSDLVGTALAGAWENLLLPALDAVHGFLEEKVYPIFESLRDLLNDTFGPAVEDVTGIFDGLGETLNGAVKRALEWVHDKLMKLKDFLTNFKLPWWLTPGSPTPFELGLRGIADAMDTLNSRLAPTLSLGSMSYAGDPLDAGPSGGEGGGDVFIEQNFYSAEAAAIGMAQVSQMRRRRLVGSMG